jgi:hypothetical protein
LVIALALAGAVLAEFELHQQPPIAEDRTPHPGAEGHHAFKARALDHAQALHHGIVEHAHGDAEALRERGDHGKARPKRRAEVGGGDDLTTPNDARKTHGDAIEAGRCGDQPGDARQHGLGGRRLRGWCPHLLGEQPAGSIHRGRLDVAAADINAERDGWYGRRPTSVLFILGPG